MGMILAGNFPLEQLGDFLMLLCVGGESLAEIAGLVRAWKAALRPPDGAPLADLEWSTYAGKGRQASWFILSALVPTRSGWWVFTHGAKARTEGRIYTGTALRSLSVPVSASLDEAAAVLSKCNFAYLPIDALSSKVAAILELRPILGLRSPMHTFARMLSPLGVACLLQGVIHLGYVAIHRRAGLLLGQPRLAIFCGDDGEIERRPNKSCEVMMVVGRESFDERWPPTINDPRQTPDSSMDLSRLAGLWRGEIEDPCGEAAVVGTLAIALRALGAAADIAGAEARAKAFRQARDRSRLAMAT